MRIFQKVQVLKLLNQHLGVYPTPMNLNWNWSWGSLSGLILASQIVTGILLAMHYVGHVDHAFASVQHLMVDVPSGIILRYAHANGASLFFTVVYLHVLRGLYYSSGTQPREIVWISGVVILLLMIITAFIGYEYSQKWILNSELNFDSSFLAFVVLAKLISLGHITLSFMRPKAGPLSYLVAASSRHLSAEMLLSKQISPCGICFDNLQVAIIFFFLFIYVEFIGVRLTFKGAYDYYSIYSANNGETNGARFSLAKTAGLLRRSCLEQTAVRCCLVDTCLPGLAKLKPLGSYVVAASSRHQVEATKSFCFLWPSGISLANTADGAKRPQKAFAFCGPVAGTRKVSNALKLSSYAKAWLPLVEYSMIMIWPLNSKIYSSNAVMNFVINHYHSQAGRSIIACCSLSNLTDKHENITSKVSYVKRYDNIHLIKTQLDILKDNKQKSGVYCVLNNVNNKSYIGSASSNRLNARFRNHCINRSGSNLVLQRSIDKYGLQNFSFLILEYFPGFVHKEDLRKSHLKLLERETYYINLINPEYNILKIGGSSLDYKHSDKTKLKMKSNYSIERRQLIGDLNRGKRLSSLTKRLQSEKRKSLFLQPDFKQNFLEKNKGTLFQGKKVQLFDLKFTLVTEYNTVTETSKIFKCCSKTIRKYLNTPNKVFKKMYYLKYKE